LYLHGEGLFFSGLVMKRGRSYSEIPPIHNDLGARRISSDHHVNRWVSVSQPADFSPDFRKATGECATENGDDGDAVKRRAHVNSTGR
jgi:hypothetical protein